jgi:hypothetical protein
LGSLSGSAVMPAGALIPGFPAALAAGSRLSRRNNTNAQQICAFNFKSVFTIFGFFNDHNPANRYAARGIFIQ